MANRKWATDDGQQETPGGKWLRGNGRHNKLGDNRGRHKLANKLADNWGKQMDDTTNWQTNWEMDDTNKLANKLVLAG